MKRILLPLQIALLAAGGVLAQAQTPDQNLATGRSYVQKPPRYSQHSLMSLEHRTPQQMSEADRQLLATRQADMVHSAALFGFNLQQEGWSFLQTVCPVLPKYVFLNYVRDDGATHFAALVPRDSDPVAIVPVVHHRVVPFERSSDGTVSLDTFNKILASSQEAGKPGAVKINEDWVALAMCYAEMAGDHPVTVLTDTVTAPIADRKAGSPTIRVESDGGVLLEFSDVSSASQTIRWRVAFDRLGRVHSAERTVFLLNKKPWTQDVLMEPAGTPRGTQPVWTDMSGTTTPGTASPK